MLKMKASKVSIPGRIMFLLMNDDSFYQEVMKLKKASSAGSFPKYDQWCDEQGFNMEFALAGYSKSDIQVQFNGQELIIKSIRPIGEREGLSDEDSCDERDSPHTLPTVPATATPKVQMGSIVRGIARRSFTSTFLISQEFDVPKTKATIKDGLLRLVVPEKKEHAINLIEVLSGE